MATAPPTRPDAPDRPGGGVRSGSAGRGGAGGGHAAGKAPSGPPGAGKGATRRWLPRVVLAGVVLAALVLVGRKYFDELHRLRDASPWHIAAMAALYLLARYLNGDVLRAALAALGHRVGRYEAFSLLLVQSYTNILIPRAGMGMPALYLKVRRNVPVADFSAVQFVPMLLLQILCMGLTGLGCLVALSRFYDLPWNTPLAVLFAGVAAGCIAPLLVPIPVGWVGGSRIGLFAARLGDSWRRLSRHRSLVLRTILVHVVMLGVRALRIQLSFHAIGRPVNYFGAFIASVLADLSFMVSVTPSALGFREAGIVYAARVMGTTGDFAFAAAILDRLVHTACNIVFGQLGVWQYIRPAYKEYAQGPAADERHR